MQEVESKLSSERKAPFITITIDKKPSTHDIDVLKGADDMLSKVNWDKKETLDLVKVQLEPDLGLGPSSTIEEIIQRAEERGYLRVPPQAGLQLRVDYREQPEREVLYMGMEPIRRFEWCPEIFLLERYRNRLYLSNRWAGPLLQWNSNGWFIFAVRKESFSATEKV